MQCVDSRRLRPGLGVSESVVINAACLVCADGRTKPSGNAQAAVAVGITASKKRGLRHRGPHRVVSGSGFFGSEEPLTG